MLLFWFLISILLENYNNFFSKRLIIWNSPLEIIFLRNFFSIFFLWRNITIDWKIILQIISITGILFFIKSKLFLFSIPFILFLVDATIKNQFNPIVLRCAITFMAFFLEISSMGKLGLGDISSAYYSIPIFSTIISHFWRKTTLKFSFLTELIIILFFIIGNLKLESIYILLACLCFGFCDVLMQNSKNKIITEIFYISIGMTLFSLSFLQGFSVFSKIIQFPQAIGFYFLIPGNILIQILIMKIFQKYSFKNLLPLRFLNIIFANALDKKSIFTPINIVIIMVILYNLMNQFFNTSDSSDSSN